MIGVLWRTKKRYAVARVLWLTARTLIQALIVGVILYNVLYLISGGSVFNTGGWGRFILVIMEFIAVVGGAIGILLVIALIIVGAKKLVRR